MDAFITLLWLLASIPLLLMVLTFMSTGDTVRGLIQDFFGIFVSIPQMLRNGCQQVLERLRGFIKTACESTGITGEHTIQRIVGGVLLTFFTVLGAAVAFLTMTVTMEGIFGSASSAIMDMLPCSLETLIALEMVTSALLFGMLLLDILNITHLTKFYSTAYLSRPLKYIFTAIFTIGTIYSIYLGVMGGFIRWSASVSTPPAEAAEKVSDTKEDIKNTTGKSNIIIADDDDETANSSDTAVVNEEQSNALKTLMEGIPLSSYGVSVFGGVGLIPFLGAFLVGIPLAALMVPMFIVRMLCDAFIMFFNVVYNFASNFMNIFIQVAESMKGLFTANIRNDQQHANPPTGPAGADQTQSPEQPTTASSQNPTGNNQAHNESNVSPQQPQQDNTPPQQQQGMYTANDANWNPLS